MDNGQNCDSYNNIPSSQTYRSDLQFELYKIVDETVVSPEFEIDIIREKAHQFLHNLLFTWLQKLRRYVNQKLILPTNVTDFFSPLNHYSCRRCVG
jgi:hypothetical protein